MSNSLLKTLHRYNFSKHPIKAVRDRVALPKQNKVYKEYESQDAVKVGDLVIDGVNYGKISENGFNALKNNTLSSYTPVDDEEAATLDNFANNYKIPLYGADGNEIGKVTYNMVFDYGRKPIDYGELTSQKWNFIQSEFDKGNYSLFNDTSRKNFIGKYSLDMPPADPIEKLKSSNAIMDKWAIKQMAGHEEDYRVLSKYNEEPLYDLIVEIDGEKRSFGKASYKNMAGLSNGVNPRELGAYSEIERKTLDSYASYVEETAKKQREPEGGWFWSGVGYVLENIGAGALDAFEDISDTAGVALHAIMNLGNVDFSKSNEENHRIMMKTPFGDALRHYNDPTVGDEWKESIESRYRVPDWYREWGGMISFEVGSLVPTIIAEVATASIAPAAEAKVVDVATKVATKGVATYAAKSTIKSATKKLAKKLIKPKLSTATLFAQSMSSATKEGFALSGDLISSLGYGVLNGLAEVATEKLFGGIAGTGIGAEDLFNVYNIKGLRKLTKAKIGKMGLNIALEGAEELIMADIEPWLRKMTVAPDMNMKEHVDFTNPKFWTKRGEAALHGVIMSAMMNAGTFAVDKTGSAINSIGIRINKDKTIKILNANSEAINSMLKENGDKLDLLGEDATVREIKERQREIFAFAAVYEQLVINEFAKSNYYDFKEMILKQYPDMPDGLIREVYNTLYELTDDGGNDIINTNDIYYQRRETGGPQGRYNGNGNEQSGDYIESADTVRTEGYKFRDGRDYRSGRSGLWNKIHGRVSGTLKKTSPRYIRHGNRAIMFSVYDNAKSVKQFFKDVYNRDVIICKDNIIERDFGSKGMPEFNASAAYVQGKILVTLGRDSETSFVHEMIHEGQNSVKYDNTVSGIRNLINNDAFDNLVLLKEDGYGDTYKNHNDFDDDILAETYADIISRIATKEWREYGSRSELFADEATYNKAKEIAEDYVVHLINNPPQTKVDTIIKDVSELGNDFADDYMFEKRENNRYFDLDGINYDVDLAISNIINGRATEVDFEHFKPGNVANRKAFYKTTGIKLPEDAKLSNYILNALNNKEKRIHDIYLKHNTNDLKQPDSLTPNDEGGIIESDIYIHKSLGAKVHRDDVLLPNGRRGKLKENSKITKVVTFAGKGTKKSVKISGWLSEKYKEYKVHPTEWKKTRGDGYVVCDDGTTRHAELHWFESDKTGRVEMKVKRYFDNES